MKALSTSRIRTRDSGDWLWGTFGLSMAACSASFAGYMIATAPTPAGSKDFGIFAQFDRRTRRGDDGLVPAAARRSGPALAQSEGAGIDPEPTGSIAPAAPPPATQGAATVLQDYVLRDVFNNGALIEHGQKLTLVRKGSILEGAGEVLAIERRDGAWVVRTAGGLINGM